MGLELSSQNAATKGYRLHLLELPVNVDSCAFSPQKGLPGGLGRVTIATVKTATPLESDSGNSRNRGIWRWNRLIGWASAAMGACTGLIMGLWSFDGPVMVPDWLGDYYETSRRLARLGHIAFFGLGILNLLLARELPSLALGDRAKRAASLTMNFGNVFLPLTLFAAAAYHPMKYLMSVPATSVLVALLFAAYGARAGESQNHAG